MSFLRVVVLGAVAAMQPLGAAVADSNFSAETEACAAVYLELLHEDVPITADSAFYEGRYALAAELAETKGSAKALVYAARAHIADAVTREDGLCLECLFKAETAAKKAISASTAFDNSCFRVRRAFVANEPGLAEAYVQLAVAIGFRGRLTSALDAQSEGLAEKGRAAIDQALELNPLDPWARAALGGWHLEIVKRAGPILASTLYRASKREGLTHFRIALAKNPGNYLLRYHFALSILALDVDDHRSEASKALLGLADTTDDALTVFTRKRADKLIELLKTGTSDQIEALVRQYQGYPPQT